MGNEKPLSGFIGSPPLDSEGCCHLSETWPLLDCGLSLNKMLRNCIFNDTYLPSEKKSLVRLYFQSQNIKLDLTLFS